MTILKIISGVLILLMSFMSIRAGWGTLTGKPDIVTMFYSWNVGEPVRISFAVITIAGSLMLLHPKTFVLGNYLNLVVVLFLVVQQFRFHNVKGILGELPVFGLSFLILYLGHPLAKN